MAVAVTKGVYHYLVAKKGRHPETESKKEGLSPSAERGTGWRLPTTGTHISRTASRKLLLRHLPNVLKPSCAEKKAKRITHS